MKNTFLLLCIIATSVLYSQNKDITGIYGQGLIGKFDPVADYIELKSDSTFTYNYDGKKYQGNWKLSENKVLLNPELKKEYARIQMKESRINSDSMTIKINYHLKKDAAGDQEFRMATIYFDKKGNYMNVLKNPYIRECSWAPVIRKQKILDNNNTVTVAQKDFSKIGVMTYHLKDYLVFTRSSKDSNFFEFDIEDVQNEDTIKDSFLILDGKFLYYPNKKGKKDVMELPLVKKKM